MPTYVLGTGLSHDGSSCLLRDGVIVAAIEKERLTRKKHDGFNDDLTLRRCLEIEGITWADVDLLVENNTTNPYDEQDQVRRGIRGIPASVPRVNISHHLAHAYSVVGTSPFERMAVAVIDGRGSSLDNCVDAPEHVLPPGCVGLSRDEQAGLWEKESLYVYDGGVLEPVFRDFSPLRRYVTDLTHPILPRSLGHGIGAMYGAVSRFVFGGDFAEGKLMGLAPYGTPGAHDFPLFDLRGHRVFNRYDWVHRFPADLKGDGTNLKRHFQAYADLAHQVQREAERAVHHLLEQYRQLSGIDTLGYAGGVALNAVCNGRIPERTGFRELYVQPAAGDNGIALGCAFHGWLSVLGKDRVRHDGSTWFAGSYGDDEVRRALAARADELTWTGPHPVGDRARIAARAIADGRVVGWFQGPSEFGPRALGHRSILGDPRREHLRDHINANVKFREDFRPFAPSVLASHVGDYFEGVLDSPYMIQVARVPADLRKDIPAVVHRDGTARLQTVTRETNPRYWALLEEMRRLTGLPMVINTSLNRRGMPIVETPAEAVDLLLTTGLDALVLEGYVVRRREPAR
ncbi:carbamoyltransferase [Kitasatospora sp. NPDC058444]|uniref:carbamoyltransferase family protein n=1 Tax=Kitasatospora sp. NPDC058444 TaxID=3346504 RepID=UPI00365DD2A1